MTVSGPPELAGYAKLVEIGRGGFATVYKARDERFNRDVAIKVLTTNVDDSAQARFDRECRAAGALSGHPAIVAVHDSGVAPDGRLYLVMEYLPGGTLAARLKSSPLPWQEAVDLGVALSGALATAHQAGVLHRDVKPENVIFTSYGTPKLVDFGIATVRGGYETKSASITASVTHAAPEVISGAKATAASDVYSLASTLFQSIAGHPAFAHGDDETIVPLIARIASAPVPDLRPLGVPASVADVIEKAMAKEPADRYPSAEAFGVALADAVPAGLPRPVMVVLPVDLEAADQGASGAGAAVPAEPTQTVGRRRQPPPTPVVEPAGPGRRRGLTVGAAAAAVLLLAGAAIAYAVTRDTKGATPLAQSSSPSPTLTPSAGTPSTPGQSPSQTPPHNHHGHPVAGTGGGSTQPGGTSTQPGGATTPPTSASSSPSAGGHHRTGGGGGTKVAAPGAPQSVFSGHVSIASRSSSSQQPTAITVTMSWAAPARGGKVAKYCVQRTVMQGSSAVSPAYASGCTSATSFSGTIVALNQGDSWLKWQVQAQNATGKSTWVTARALVPYLIGGKDYDGTQKLRGAGLRPNYATAGKPSQASDANKVTDESPTGGSLTGGSFVYMKSYDDYS